MKKMLIALMFVTIVISACGEKKEGKSGIKVLKLSHNHAEGYPVDLAYKKFAELVESKTEGRYTVEIYPSATLGDQKASVGLVQSDVIQFAHINSAPFEAFDSRYAILNLPYVFKDYNHYRTVMDSPKIREMFEDTVDKGFITLLYLEGGARSFYTKNKVINTPADLRGLKIRVQDSPTHIEMIQLLGGTPVILNFSEVYTSLQQGVIDGAENNAPSFVQTGHAEVAKNFSLNEHLRLSDLLVVSGAFWKTLTEEDKQKFRDAGNETIGYFVDVWNNSEQEAFNDAVEKYDVTITKVDTEPFRNLVLPLHKKTASVNAEYTELLELIRSLENVRALEK